MKKLILLLLFAIFIAGCKTVEEETTVEEDTLDISFRELSSKFVYDNGQDIDLLKQHCQENNGRFNECGTMCEPGEICVTVCALTCEFEETVVTGGALLVAGAACETDEDCNFILNSPWPDPSCLNTEHYEKITGKTKEWEIDDSIECICSPLEFPDKEPSVIIEDEGTLICKKV